VLIGDRVSQTGHEADVLKYAKRIQNAGGHMNRLVGDLLDVASIHSGALAVRKEQGDPAAVLNEAMESFQEQASLCGVRLSLERGEHLPPVEFDAARILQVLTNLLSNALKFTRAGGEVVLAVEAVGQEMRFSVTDTGVGVPGHMLETIFDRFLQVGQNDRRGVGLGLYISRCIVQGHGGRIWVESELGQGSAFRFAIPIPAAA
jgi:signal transduction histidine kinase